MLFVKNLKLLVLRLFALAVLMIRFERFSKLKAILDVNESHNLCFGYLIRFCRWSTFQMVLNSVILKTCSMKLENRISSLLS